MRTSSCIQSSTKLRETFRQITQKLGQIAYILVFYKFHFLGFFHWTVSILFFCCVTVKTICIEST